MHHHRETIVSNKRTMMKQIYNLLPIMKYDVEPIDSNVDREGRYVLIGIEMHI